MTRDDKAGANSHRMALITGAGRGIGRGIALALAERGWDITINYRRNAKAAVEAVRLVQKAGGHAIAVQANIANTDDRGRLVDEAMRVFGRIDMLVNNAGMAPRERVDILHVGEDSYDEVMAVNLKGPLFLTQRVARIMIDLLQKGVIEHPKIVNIGSISAYTSSPSRGEYCISKAGLAMVTKLFADRLAEFGIHVYEVRPGIIETDMTNVVKDKYDHLIAEGLTPIRRWGHPDDIGLAVAAIAEGYFPFSTGEVINVDGGFHLRRL
ncbi:MAG: 3-ketoacyl-ACP reductase [Anaerolineae bacterium]|nr:3-ketoacyl-ACP reductase [Anaerolineae bacterium]